MSSPAEPHLEFHYTSLEHQSETAIAGMWLFLATEVLFFGAAFLVYFVQRHYHPEGFREASAHAEFTVGTINTLLLVTGSLSYTWGLSRAQRGDNRRLLHACVVTALIGIAFMGLKLYEWSKDFDEHLFPGPTFALQGADSGGAQLFYSFYFVMTGLHGVHLTIGIAAVLWIAWHARRNVYSPQYHTPVEVVGLYWSFVDIVWLILYPSIYLVSRGTA